MLQYKISKTSTKNIYNFAVISLLPILREEKGNFAHLLPMADILYSARKPQERGWVGVGGVV